MIIGITSGLFLSYMILFFIASEITSRKEIKKNKNLSPINIIIPAFNEEKVISKCINSILKQKGKIIKQIIIILDNCTDKTEEMCEEFAKKNENIIMLKKNDLKPSKVESVIKALKLTKDKFFAIIDADTVLANDAIIQVYGALANNGADFATCLIDPHHYESFLYKLISWDRIFRQRIIQLGKDFFDIANFPGCFGVVKTKKFKELLKHEILEDLLLTLKAIRINSKIKIIPEVLAFEQEKRNINKLLFQRIRWTIGNIKISKEFLKTFMKIKITRKILLLSYPLLWYFIYYYLAFLSIILIFTRFESFILLNYIVISLLLYLMLIYNNIKFKQFKFIDFFTLATFIIIFPLIISTALVFAILKLLKTTNSMMINKKYFQR